MLRATRVTRYYGGCADVDIVENIARERACRLFGAEHANVQPHSGAQANLAVYFALLQPGDTVLGMNLAEGGHLTHGSPVNMSGAYYNFAAYGVDPVTHRIDYDKLMEQACELKPKLIVAGASAYPRAIDFKKFREIADACGAYLMVDMAHIAGLVAGGCHMNPVPYADVVTTTTHKTLRGPRGGMILCKEEYAKEIDKAIFPGTQGGPLMHIIAGKSGVLRRGAEARIQDLCRADRSQRYSACRKAFTRRGMKLVSGGTDNHLMLVDLSDRRADRQRAGASSRRSVYHRKQEHDPERAEKPVRHKRRASRHTGRHHARPEGSRYGRHRGVHRTCVRSTISTTKPNAIRGIVTRLHTLSALCIRKSKPELYIEKPHCTNQVQCGFPIKEELTMNAPFADRIRPENAR